MAPWHLLGAGLHCEFPGLEDRPRARVSQGRGAHMSSGAVPAGPPQPSGPWWWAVGGSGWDPGLSPVGPDVWPSLSEPRLPHLEYGAVTCLSSSRGKGRDEAESWELGQWPEGLCCDAGGPLRAGPGTPL